LEHGSVAPLPPLGTFYAKLAQYVEIEREQSRGQGWMHWLTRRLFHTVRSRSIATVRLCLIWIIPGGVRLPFRYELARYWYAARLIAQTCPLSY
jgi:hypothetical protein